MTKLKELLDLKPAEVPDHPPCAFCSSDKTEFMALFGQFLLVSQYYCHNCHSVFEWCKWQNDEQGSREAEEQRSGGETFDL